MQAELTKKPMTLEDIAMICDYEAAKTRDSYKREHMKPFNRNVFYLKLQ